MDPARKRRVRLVVALTAAVLLAAALVYTSFSASTGPSRRASCWPAPIPAALPVDRQSRRRLDRKRGTTYEFRVRDRDGTASVPIRYSGAVPDPFRAGREVIINVERQGGPSRREGLAGHQVPSKFKDAEVLGLTPMAALGRA